MGARFQKRDDEPEVEGGRGGARGAKGSEEVGKKGRPTVIPYPP